MEAEYLDQEAAETAWGEAEEPAARMVEQQTAQVGPENMETGGGREEATPGAPPEARGPGAEAQAGPQRAPEEMGEALREFLDTFPEVKGEEVPKEVWDAAIQGQSLALAYSLHRSRALERELAALRQDRENRLRSTGSMARNVPGSTEDLISMWWNEAD